MVEIRENLLSQSKYNLKCPVEATAAGMKYIVVHNTGNCASAANEVAYMIRNNSSTSFNAAVDDKEIVIGIPFDKGAFAAGKRYANAHGIHIEICYSLNDEDIEKFKKAERNAAEYIAKLLQERGWDISHVKKHQDFDGKYCPHRTLKLGWQRFVKMVKAYLNAENNQPAETEKETAAKAVNYKARVTAKDGLRVRKGAGVKYSVVKVLAQGTQVTVTAEQNGWGYIVDGWVSLEWVKKIADVAVPAFEPYLFRTTCDVLNIRSGPGTNYPVIGQIKDKKRYTIVEERTGSGSAKGWGRLKAGGWVAKDWVEKTE